MNNSKKKLFFVTALIILIGYYSNDYKYNKSKYTIINKDAYASYSDGLIYIGDDEFLSTINCNENDILVCDDRENTDDPDIIIYNSCSINDKDKRNEILEVICEYEKCYPTSWDRSIESMRLEWFMHNIGYYFEIKRNRTADVDLNNKDERKYNNKVLSKLLKL